MHALKLKTPSFRKSVCYIDSPEIEVYISYKQSTHIHQLCSYNIPLVADIHFAPPIALRVAECFDKIRVNPGNFGT